MQLFLINIVICSWASGELTGPCSDIVFFLQATGEDFNVEGGKGKRSFRALLDVGLVRTTTGNRVFGALKVHLYISFIYFIVRLDGTRTCSLSGTLSCQVLVQFF